VIVSVQSVPERNHRRLLGMLLLSLVAALTIHGDLCAPAHEAGHHRAAAYAIDQDDSHGHGDSYHCRDDHEYAPSAVAERPGRTPRHADGGTSLPYADRSAPVSSAADVARSAVPSQRRSEPPSGRDILTTVCVSRV
jgi:hypothetical protein